MAAAPAAPAAHVAVPPVPARVSEVPIDAFSDEKFIKEHALDCIICFHPIEHAMTVSPCGTRALLVGWWHDMRAAGDSFCGSCIAHQMNHYKPQCPRCTQLIEQGVATQAVDRKVAALRVKCLAPLCAWSGEQGAAGANWVAHTRVCSRVVVGCSSPDCKKALPRGEMKEHEAVCEHQLGPCINEPRCTVELPPALMAAHLAICEHEPAACPHAPESCGEFLERGTAAKHMCGVKVCVQSPHAAHSRMLAVWL